jgi:uncharacterized protein (TIGR03067 family)
MKWITLLSVLAGLSTLGQGPSADDVKKEVEKFQGSWTITKIERDGEDLSDQIGGAEMEVKGEKYTAPNIAATFKLDPSKKPKAIDISYSEGPAAGQTVKGIYKLDGATLTICRALAEGSERPTEFAAPAGSGKMLFEFKRKKND